MGRRGSQSRGGPAVPSGGRRIFGVLAPSSLAIAAAGDNHNRSGGTMSNAPSTLSVAERRVFLIGRPPINEFVGFMTEQTIEGKTADRRQLGDEWRKANDHVLKLEETEAGAADHAQIHLYQTSSRCSEVPF
jgi:hypothetical protein